MIQKKISGDITKMESKLFFGFTLRQLVCMAIGIVLEYINIKTLKNEFVGVTVVALCFAEGWVKMGAGKKPFLEYMFEIGKFSFSQKERVYGNNPLDMTPKEVRSEIKEYAESGIMSEELEIYMTNELYNYKQTGLMSKELILFSEATKKIKGNKAIKL